ncbi:TetR family transcriptional regulator [Actinomadura craniellae]|uniref:TetR family transcriptional regulator n=1 Tax=Actinomadura craniellae TaxID=2231787 RepID=A0A365H8H7_9ACTN|nr:TetR family transcriptional regulator [Actinomadura craniellae]RAY15322.1 TetR family transcriptional regulator [Actinomadura craniellae]
MKSEPDVRQTRRPGRRPGPTETRAAILAAARELFAEKGYDGTSLRAIARAAGCDPALVHHFFGNKEGVFTTAMQFPVTPADVLPRLLEAPPDQLGETLVRIFLEIWRDEERRAPVIAMVRSAMTNEQAATLMREFITTALLRRVAAARGTSLLRAEAAVGQMVGVAILRYVIKTEPVASASEEELVELLAPVIQHYLG